MRNRLFEIFEKDVLRVQYGRLQIGDYYLRCYITGSKKTEYLLHKHYMMVELTIQTDLTDWVKENTNVFHIGTGSAGEYLNYPYDYPHDFKNRFRSLTTVNHNFVPTNFKMIIEGFFGDQVYSPQIFINGHLYEIDVHIKKGERVVIDSVEKTIELITTTGERVNCFNKRGRDSYIFEKIPSGEVNISSPHGVTVTLTLFEERSEPKWT